MTASTAFRGLRVLLIVALALVCGLGAADENLLFQKWIMMNSDPLPQFVTNMPESFLIKYVIPANIGRGRMDKIEFHGLDAIGDDDAILPYDWEKKCHTIMIVDTSQATEAEMEAVWQVRKKLFIRETLDPDFNAYWIIQNAGKGAGENFRVLVAAPGEQYLLPLIREINNVPSSALKSGSGEALEKGYNVNRVRVVSNVPDTADGALTPAFSGDYDDLTILPLEEMGQEAEYAPTVEVSCFAWNADEPVGFEDVESLLPETVAERVRNFEGDRRGFSAWQAECRRLVAHQTSAEDGTPRWYVAAPTERHLTALLPRVISAIKSGEPYELDREVPADLTDCSRLAIGAYLLNEEANAEKLIIQHRLEDVTRHRLPVEVVAGDDIGSVLNQVLGDNAESPFAAPSGVDQVVASTNADYLLLLWAQSVRPQLRYDYNSRRLTPRLDPFDEPEPERPHPDDRKGLFGGHKYPGKTTEQRAASYAYRQALAAWADVHDDWEDRRDDYERLALTRRVEYSMDIYSVPEVELDGYLKLVDLRTKQVIWSREVSAAGRGDQLHIRNDNQTVVGENASPGAPNLPPTEREWTEATYVVGRDALVSALSSGLEGLMVDGLFAEDLQPWNIAGSDAAAPGPIADAPAVPDSSGELFVLSSLDGSQHTGELAAEPIRIESLIGTQELEAANIQQIARNGDAWVVSLAGGTTLTGSLLNPGLTVLVDGAPVTVAAAELNSAQRTQPPEPERYVATLTDGSQVTVHLQAETVGFQLAAGMAVDVPTEAVVGVSRNGEQVSVECADGNILVGSFAAGAASPTSVDDGTPLDWAQIAGLLPEESAAAAAPAQPVEETPEPETRSYQLAYGQLEPRDGTLCMPLRDLFEAFGIDISAITVTSHQGKSVCSFPWNGDTIRVREGDAEVFVNGIGKDLPTAAYGTDRMYVPIDVIDVAMGMEVQADMQTPMLTCINGHVTTEITTP